MPGSLLVFYYFIYFHKTEEILTILTQTAFVENQHIVHIENFTERLKSAYDIANRSDKRTWNIFQMI